MGFQHTDFLWAGDNLAITGAFTGQKTGSTANHGNGGDENTQILGRISERLWTNGYDSNVQIGASGAEVLDSGTSVGGGSQTLNFQDRPEIRVDGTRLISTGGIAAKTGHMFAVDAGGNWHEFFVGGEYASFTADRLVGGVVADHPDFDGWYLEASWVLTGEAKQYSPGAINNEVGGFQAPIPSAPFSLSGDSWGAWELAVRYSDTDLNWHTNVANGVFGGKEKILAIGVNWYLNRDIRLMIDDNIVSVDKGTFAAPTSQSQDLNIVGVRLQFSN